MTGDRELAGEPATARRDGGFVLLEAVVAMSLIMIVMTSVTSFFLVTMRINREQQQAQVAAQLATSGMALVHSVRGPVLINGRDATSSTSQWNSLTSAVSTYLSGSVLAWDAAASTGSGPTATLPTTPQSTTMRGLTYQTSYYLGSCWQPAAGGACTQTSVAGAAPMYRVVVAVTWTDAACANSACTYVDTTLASSSVIDPILNPGGTPVSSTPTGALGGSPETLPGTVEAEAYDLGGQGVGYSVTSVNGSAPGYRYDAVDIETTTDSSGNYDLAWTAAGQWQKYTVNAAYTGAYTFAYRFSAPSAVTDAFHLTNASGTTIGSNVNLSSTGSYNTWSTYTVAGTVTLSAGQQTLTLVQDHVGWKLNDIVVGATEVPYNSTPAAIPGQIEAENYDYGSEGVGYHVTSVNGSGYRLDSVDIGSTSDGNGYNIGWSTGGQWMRYTVTVATTKTYTVTYRVATPSAVTDAFHLANAAGTTTIGSNVNLPNSGGWGTWANATATVNLTAGTQTIMLKQDNGGWNLNSFTFS